MMLIDARRLMRLLISSCRVLLLYGAKKTAFFKD